MQQTESAWLFHGVMQSAKVAKRWPTAAAQTASVSEFHWDWPSRAKAATKLQGNPDERTSKCDNQQ